MKINSLLSGDLYFDLADEEKFWDYCLIGSNLVWCGIWIYGEGDLYKKKLRELKWR